MKKKQLSLFAVYLIAMTMLAQTGFLAATAAISRTYTVDADFDEGTLVGVEHETVHDQLQLSRTFTTLPFIWVPSLDGTVSKINTVTGKELGRYRVAPLGVSPGGGSPSRTTVDLQGNCWVGNREAGTAVKIGLLEAGSWIDRNSNGVPDTSMDLDDDGSITGAELLPWGQDECVLYEVVLILGSEATYVPGTYPGPYDTNDWGVSPRGFAVDAFNNVWVGTWITSRYYYIDGTTGIIMRSVDVSPHNAYGAALDGNGILWSTEGPGGDQPNIMLRLDTSSDAISFFDVGHTCYGLGLDYDDHLWVSSYWDYRMSRIDVLTDPPTFVTYNVPEQFESRGVAATSDNDIWVANTGADTVTRYDNDGNLLATITGFNGPTGVSVDADGKVWATNLGDLYVHRIDPATDTIDLSKSIVGSAGHYTYSDMTGIVARSITTRIGTWTVVFDSGAADMPWGLLSWTSLVPTDTSLSVRVRSSNDQTSWSGWETAANGNPLGSTPNGRYLEIEVTLQIIQGDTSPILYDLTVARALGTYDIAINNVFAVETVVGQNYTAMVMSIVENQGNFTETFNLTAYYDGTAMSTEQWPDGAYSQTFWSMGDAVRDGYIDLWDLDLIAYEFGWSGPVGKNPADINSDGKVDVHDAFTAGGNFGFDIWTFFGIPRLVRNQTVVTLPSGQVTVIAFRWNTTNVNKGNYVLSANASYVSGETDLADNGLVDGAITVAMIGDINGETRNVPDGKVDMRDVGWIATAFGIDVGADITNPGPGMFTWLQYWHMEPCSHCPHHPNCDITGYRTGVPDGKIDMRDIGLVASRFGDVDP